MNALQKLENWWGEKKGRYVSDLSISTTYGATCWSLTLGNVNVTPGEDWFKSSEWAKKYNRAEVYAEETSFYSLPEKIPPNIIFGGEGEFVGLEKTILVALKKAEELGL